MHIIVLTVLLTGLGFGVFSWARTTTLDGASEYSDRDGYLAPLKWAVSNTFSKISSLATSTVATKEGAGADGPVLQQPPARGVYLWGGVGCGKTLMMDMLYSCVTLRHAEEQVAVLVPICSRVLFLPSFLQTLNVARMLRRHIGVSACSMMPATVRPWSERLTPIWSATGRPPPGCTLTSSCSGAYHL